MKIKAKILAMAMSPLILLGVIVLVINYNKINAALTSSIENGLRGAAVSVRDTIAYSDEGEYVVDEAGNLLKGEFNVTEHVAIADNMKESADTDITVFYGDTRYMTSVTDDAGKRVLGTKAGASVVDIVLKGGQEYFSTDVDVEGHKYFGYYVPLRDDSGAIVGMIFSGMPQEDARAQIMEIILYIIGVTVILIILGAILLIFTTGAIAKGLAKGAETLETISKGDLSVKLDSRLAERKDEIGILARSVGVLHQELLDIISTLKTESKHLKDASEYLHEKTSAASEHMAQVDKAVEEIAEGAGSQAEETQNATENIIRMGNMIEEDTEDIANLTENTKSIKQRGESAIVALRELRQTNEKTKASIDVIYEQTHTTNESAQKIKEATALITDIAEETNLLSLNASIEAARAGEQGRGFAVVASQIQKLAEQSNESARQIEAIITSLLEDSDKSVMTMNEVKDVMDQQSENVENTNAEVTQVLEEVENAILAIEGISRKTEEINEARNNVVDTVQNLSAIAEENAASSEETSASVSEVGSIIGDIAERAERLRDISNKLDEVMSIFRIEA